MDFRTLEVLLHRDWPEAMRGWPDPDSNRVLLRPVDVSPPMSFDALEGNLFDTPISWANKPFEIEAMWQNHR